jgi:hypothetical protein
MDQHISRFDADAGSTPRIACGGVRECIGKAGRVERRDRDVNSQHLRADQLNLPADQLSRGRLVSEATRPII